jgi:hypothetical protein
MDEGESSAPTITGNVGDGRIVMTLSFVQQHVGE